MAILTYQNYVKESLYKDLTDKCITVILIKNIIQVWLKIFSQSVKFRLHPSPPRRSPVNILSVSKAIWK